MNHLYNVISHSLLNQIIMQNTTQLQGNWNETKGKLKQKFAMLTDNDLLLLEGKQDELDYKLSWVKQKKKYKLSLRHYNCENNKSTLHVTILFLKNMVL